jgi:hypothetical protein
MLTLFGEWLLLFWGIHIQGAPCFESLFGRLGEQNICPKELLSFFEENR